MNWHKEYGIAEPYYSTNMVCSVYGDALEKLSQLPSDSIDLLATDPPYGISFMGKDWDKALPDKRIWSECFRVLKLGAFAFVMSIPRADCLSRMIISLEDAGFWVNFTPIFWAYASGFPKAQNIGKAVDKKLGAERTKGDIRTDGRGKWELKMNRERGDTGIGHADGSKQVYQEEFATSPQAKALDGSYGGFQPKLAVEVIIVCMKPLSEKTFVDQALKNKKGITWLDDCRVPYESEEDKESARFGTQMDIRNNNYKTPQGVYGKNVLSSQSGRFPANLLVSDDALNDGRIQKSGIAVNRNRGERKPSLVNYANHNGIDVGYPDSGSFSRYFDLDKWCQFLIVPKASKSEKNRGLLGGTGSNTYNRKCLNCGKWERKQGLSDNYTCHCEKPEWEKPTGNSHPTVKPLKLMSYLITLGSREGDTVLDPFAGSGTTALACQLLSRKNISVEINKAYCEIAKQRCSQGVFDLSQ